MALVKLLTMRRNNLRPFLMNKIGACELAVHAQVMQTAPDLMMCQILITSPNDEDEMLSESKSALLKVRMI